MSLSEDTTDKRIIQGAKEIFAHVDFGKNLI